MTATVIIVILNYIYTQDLYKIRQRAQGLKERGGGAKDKIVLEPKLKK